MTNDDYLSRLDAMRKLPIEQQLAEAIVIIGERATSSASGAVVQLVEPLATGQAEIKAELTRVTIAVHALGNAGMGNYAQIDAINEEGTAWGRERLAEGEQRMERVETMLETGQQERQAIIRSMQALFWWHAALSLIMLLILTLVVLWVAGRG